mmetsp:Transcript_5713/g.13286  ORF Transcript_5713/g.13286 Transcript_5713/m.13286 type:complete len:210 (+) Transcript_5713:651-1280(+)
MRHPVGAASAAQGLAARAGLPGVGGDVHVRLLRGARGEHTEQLVLAVRIGRMERPRLRGGGDHGHVRDRARGSRAERAPSDPDLQDDTGVQDAQLVPGTDQRPVVVSRASAECVLHLADLHVDLCDHRDEHLCGEERRLLRELPPVDVHSVSNGNRRLLGIRGYQVTFYRERQQQLLDWSILCGVYADCQRGADEHRGGCAAGRVHLYG